MSTLTTDTSTWLRPPSVAHSGWQYEIRCDILRDDPDPSELAQISALARRLFNALKASRHGRDADSSLSRLFAPRFEQLCVDCDNPENSFITFEDALEEFNQALDDLYSWGDETRVILNLG